MAKIVSIDVVIDSSPGDALLGPANVAPPARKTLRFNVTGFVMDPPEARWYPADVRLMDMLLETVKRYNSASPVTVHGDGHGDSCGCRACFDHRTRAPKQIVQTFTPPSAAPLSAPASAVSNLAGVPAPGGSGANNVMPFRLADADPAKPVELI